MERNKVHYEPVNDSRLNGWERQRGKLWISYYPDLKNAEAESPIFAHIIALKQIKEGANVDKDVIDVVCHFAKRGEEELRTWFDDWNKNQSFEANPGFLGFDELDSEGINVDITDIIEDAKGLMASSFGQSDDVEEIAERFRLMSDAMTFEGSTATSVSVN